MDAYRKCVYVITDWIGRSVRVVPTAMLAVDGPTALIAPHERASPRSSTHSEAGHSRLIG